MHTMKYGDIHTHAWPLEPGHVQGLHRRDHEALCHEGGLNPVNSWHCSGRPSSQRQERSVLHWSMHGAPKLLRAVQDDISVQGKRLQCSAAMQLPTGQGYAGCTDRAGARGTLREGRQAGSGLALDHIQPTLQSNGLTSIKIQGKKTSLNE